ncbi:recombinase family protein [Corynebacterium marquesiae]|uniref:recombinase family protein n=1 Tax=Corynebacterium marquesiae TaxID=2913503 RepID=UPI00254FDC89|nr:recombinase family protein [Corynebacterium marquesiae]MDK8455911.1 recombinase family protein [Corynebacterium marquesiae]MDK8726031.1 recombinase family protein [Corynebacterium marquesiae]MDK8771351.1 recombinase family protein [Corynebacterium marquesiae]
MYARNSTPIQESPSFSCGEVSKSFAAQEEALIAAGCDSKHIYSDTASGAQSQRPGLEAARSFLRDGDSLVVTRLDRLGRSIAEVVKTVADLDGEGVSLKVLEPELDTSRSADKLMVNILSSLAEE